MISFKPRPKQQAVLDYESGKMGVSAVPGSGKTWTLSLLAAKLIARGDLADDQEVLIVTLVNSAVQNFSSRVGRFVQERYHLLPNVGYRVRTLHGLAHDIVRERPALIGLSDEFQIVDERASDEMLQEAARAWARQHPDSADDFLALDLDGRRASWVRNEQWPDLVVRVANSFIKQAKDLQLTPPELRYLVEHHPDPLPLLEMGCDIYAEYQRALAYRGGVDFADLIRLALRTLQIDPDFKARLQHRWPYILEDEAQDSSRLQELILRELSGPEGNWVRVGDPNQAIYETFTTADPRYLLDFMRESGVDARDLPNSGRSMQSIIDMANELIRWTRAEHPVGALQSALATPYIEPTPPGDPQPNPADDPSAIHLGERGYAPHAEIAAVAASIERWLPEHEDQTVAVLVPRNTRGFEVANELKQRGIAHIELLRSTHSTRATAGALGNIVRYLADPTATKKLVTVYRVWRRDDRASEIDPTDAEAQARVHRLEQVTKLLKTCRHVEDFLWPRPDHDWLAATGLDEEAPELYDHLRAFRALVRRWQDATTLPIDQLILTLAQDLFTGVVDLALAHKLALVLHRAAEQHPNWRLPELTRELAVVAKNERKFLGFSEEDSAFDPDAHPGKVVIATMHKAKGLEWDRVYLMAVNDYNFPSALPQDTFIGERWFVRESLNLEAEVLAQLEGLHENTDLFFYEEGGATRAARRDYAAERLRLFYVGITRARRSLVITWNTGRDGHRQPAVPLIALQTWWEERGPEG